MNENQEKAGNLVDTTDCLEAVGVFRGWKNFLFIIIVLALLLLQASFWLVDTGQIKIDDGSKQAAPSVAADQPEQSAEPAQQAVGETEQIAAAAKQVTTAANEPAAAEPQPPQPQRPLSFFSYVMKLQYLLWLVRFLNFVLIPAAALYCLTMLFSLKVSLLGRLGGINHICRAFFLSLVFFVLLLPWQRFFAGVFAGAIYTPQELLDSCSVTTKGIFGLVFHYLRFTGYWLLVLLLLMFSQFRSARWAKAVLHRLEIV